MDGILQQRAHNHCVVQRTVMNQTGQLASLPFWLTIWNERRGGNEHKTKLNKLYRAKIQNEQINRKKHSSYKNNELMTAFYFSACVFNKNKRKRCGQHILFPFCCCRLMFFFLCTTCFPLHAHPTRAHSCVTMRPTATASDSQNNSRCISQVKPQKQIQLILRLKRSKDYTSDRSGP